MAHILTYDLIDRQQWSELVRTSETGTWFQSPEAYDFFASMPELMEPFVYGVERAGKLCAVCVGYVTKEPNPIKQFFTRRAIIIGGPCLADDASSEEVEALMIAVKNLPSLQGGDEGRLPSPIYIETRNFNDFSPWKEAFEAAGFVYKPHLNFHVDPSTNNLSDNRKRQLKKSDAVVSEGVSELEIREWYEVLSELYRTKVKTPLWSIDFFLEAYRQGVGKFLLVKHEGKVIGGSMVVMSERVKELGNEGTVYEWFECGLNADYKEQYPSVMATWAGMQYANEHGCARYDMMGAGVPGVPYGVRDFKSEFGGELVEHGRFLCVNNPVLYKMGVLAVKLLKRK